ncbi:MAG: flagellar hook-basal body complex protein FliE [Pirellulaceae bacterium]|jgi:flagellar hook-basal body complex protein FliE|nr:flagellar hook-basal body complex protein FliE [Pirellulaceae bacterium]
MQINSGLHIPAAPAPPPAPRGDGAGGPQASSFKDLLLDGLQQVNSMQQQADHAVQQLMTGADVDPAVVLTAVQKADISFRLMMQIRNKLVQAYQEVKDIRI